MTQLEVKFCFRKIIVYMILNISVFHVFLHTHYILTRVYDNVYS